MNMSQDDFIVETTQMRLYNPKPRSYRYNMKDSNPRLAKLEKATDKSYKGATNLNTQETRILGLILQSLEVGKAAFTAVMAARQQKVVLENRHRKITHMALQTSLKQGFLALNQFQNSGFRTKVVSDIEKELSPAKLKKRKLQRLSRKCFEESTAIGIRNTAILTQKMEKKGRLTPICERVPPISRPITIPTAESPVKASTKSFTTNNTHKHISMTAKPLPRPVNMAKMNCINSIDLELSDDEYDEGGFTPRPLPVCHNNLNKLPKVPCISKEPSIFITAPNELL